ncbi:MAG: DNA repair protein RadA [Patescibacteria group bacterium]|nr:DNA repair protein RadA [Patescibacteria group bacterium]
MAKLKTTYVCTECGASYPRWMGKCESCGNWNTLAEEVIETKGSRAPSKATPAKTGKIGGDGSAISERFSTKISEVDQVLGGGIVPGSLILLGGDPGIGKSTLVLDMAASVGDVLYASGEESENQIRLRAERLGVKDGIALLSETNIETIIATILSEKPKLTVIDSIQTMYSADIDGAPGNVSQLSLCASKLMNVAKENHIAIVIIGHVTKQGNIAGPRVLEHLVDVVLYIEGDRFGSFRILRGVKNRFGSTNEVGIFEMTASGMKIVKNPSELMIAERAQAPGSVIFPAMEGTRPLLTEIQALTSPSSFGYPKRTASGFDLNRLNLLVAVLQKRCNINLSILDVYLNIAGGIKVSEPAADLAVCLAIASVAKNKKTKEGVVILGEVGLAGEVRSVNNIEKRLAEAAKLGFTEAVIPKSKVKAPEGIHIIEARTVREAIDKTVS